jgi:hypothetical protein
MAIDSAGQRPRDSVSEDLEERLTRSRAVRQREERKWILQLAYYGGRQWTAIDGSGRLYEPEIGPHKLRLVDNRIMPGVLTQVAKMSKMRPSMSVAPSSGDQLDFDAAKMGETVLDEKWESLDLTRKRRQAILWSRVCAAGFWKICWDDRRGDPFEVMAVDDGAGQDKILLGPDQQPLRSDDPTVAAVLNNVDPAVAETARAKTLFPGDVMVAVRSPFAIFPDPLAPEEGLEDTDWLIEESIVSPAYIRDRYNVDLEADTSASAGVMESRMPGLEGDGSKVGVIVREFWARKCAEFPQGQKVVYAQGQVLEAGNNPYGWLPHVMFRGTPYPGRFWPTCFTEQSISPQTELNNIKSQIHENAARVGNPPLAKSRQADVSWDGLPGSVLEYNDTLQNSLPSFLQVPEMPAYIQNLVPELLDSISDSSGQHEVSQGAVPTGVTAAAAINLLQEADDTRIGPDIEDMEKSLADAGKRILQLVATYYTDGRILRIAGDEQSWTIIPDFKGAMLRGNTDVQVQAGSTMPRSKAAQQAAMQEMVGLLVQYGYQMDQRSLRRFFMDYGVGGLDRLTNEIDADEKQVAREHQKFQAGLTFLPNEWDAHELHIEAHNEFRKTTTFERLPPQTQQAIAQHVLAHQQTVQLQQQQQFQAQVQQEMAMAQAQAPPQTPNEGGASNGT